MTKPARFTKLDVQRAVAGAMAGARAAGTAIGRIELAPSGKIVILFGDSTAAHPAGDENEWDEVLEQ